MGRKPDGSVARNETLAVRLTEAGLAKIDEARGSWSRSEFIRRAVAHYIQHGPK
jgi:metal-responsive CopG/Arc/MetJ family transcriptional regulator